jgi:hypothetical protein
MKMHREDAEALRPGPEEKKRKRNIELLREEIECDSHQHIEEN